MCSSQHASRVAFDIPAACDAFRRPTCTHHLCLTAQLCILLGHVRLTLVDLQGWLAAAFHACPTRLVETHQFVTRQPSAEYDTGHQARQVDLHHQADSLACHVQAVSSFSLAEESPRALISSRASGQEMLPQMAHKQGKWPHFTCKMFFVAVRLGTSGGETKWLSRVC